MQTCIREFSQNILEVSNNPNTLSNNPTKWSNTLKQFVGSCYRRIACVCLTILWGWRLQARAMRFSPFQANIPFL